MWRRVVTAIAVSSSFSSFAVELAPVLVAGEISSTQKFSVVAPRLVGWSTKIDWMKPEGEIVDVGETVVVFARAELDAKLENLSVQIQQAQSELEQANIDGDLKVVKAEGELFVASLQLEKANIKASIPAKNLSAYDYETYKLQLQQAAIAQDKAKRNLVATKEERQANLQQQAVALEKLAADLALTKNQSQLTEVKSTVSGAIVYGRHPWFKNKLTAGSTVQPTWAVADVVPDSGIMVKAWVNETEKARLNQGQSVSIALDAYPQLKLSGKLTHLASQSEEKPEWGTASYFELMVAFDQKPQVKLLQGMSVLITEQQ